MSTVLIAQFCNNSFKEAGKNFQVTYLTMRLPNMGHSTFWSNRVMVTTLWQLHFIKHGQIQGYKKSAGSQSSLSYKPIDVF